MNIILIFALLFCATFQTLQAKGSVELNQAFEEYRKNRSDTPKSNVRPEQALSDLLKLENYADLSSKILPVLTIVRDSPSKDVIPQLKKLWSRIHTHTFRVTEPEDWRNIKTEDYAQMFCDEIKVLIKSMGGDIDDIEPLDERNTHELNEIRSAFLDIKNGSQKNLKDARDTEERIAKLIEIIKRCKFGSSNEDEKLQLFYVLEIIDLLGTETVWSGKERTDAAGPEIIFFDELLSKTLPLIDENWVQKPTGPEDHIQDAPSVEQAIQWRINSLEGYQQLNLRKIRDQILISISNLIEIKKSDDAFKQEMLKRFGKTDASRKVILDRLNSSK